jgi:hypothetical protein
MNDELKRMLKEVVISKCEVLSLPFLGRCVESHKILTL